MRVLVAEDDVRLAGVLEQSLREAGWEVEVVHDGRSAYTRALPGGVAYDVLLLDWMLPELDGVAVCRRLRDLGVTTPVLVLTARGEVRDRIRGLDSGAAVARGGPGPDPHNLRDNAERHGAPPITVTTERRGGCDVVTVVDAGPGMTPALLATATERFTRAPEARSRPGAGLGLALVERLVTDAGGELRLCFAGAHTSYGVHTRLPCEHDERMTAAAFLPLDHR